MPALIRSGESSQALLQPVPFNGLIVKSSATALPALNNTCIHAPMDRCQQRNLIAFVSDANGNPIFIWRRAMEARQPISRTVRQMISARFGHRMEIGLHSPAGSMAIIPCISCAPMAIRRKRSVTRGGVSAGWARTAKKSLILTASRTILLLPTARQEHPLKVIDLDGNKLQDTYFEISNQVDQLQVVTKWAILILCSRPE